MENPVKAEDIMIASRITVANSWKGHLVTNPKVERFIKEEVQKNKQDIEMRFFYYIHTSFFLKSLSSKKKSFENGDLEVALIAPR